MDSRWAAHEQDLQGARPHGHPCPCSLNPVFLHEHTAKNTDADATLFTICTNMQQLGHQNSELSCLLSKKPAKNLPSFVQKPMLLSGCSHFDSNHCPQMNFHDSKHQPLT